MAIGRGMPRPYKVLGQSRRGEACFARVQDASMYPFPEQILASFAQIEGNQII
jgi:hypothetical protein